ncbi:ABC transporter permease [Roseburia hominis]
MILRLEFSKLRRTGYVPAFLAGGLLASAFPIANMAFRQEMYLHLPQDPLTILTDANWQMMAMLNILLAVCGACIMYHTEYANNGVQKMNVLPVRPETIFLGKCITAFIFSAVMILLETAAFTGCALYWFPGYEPDFTKLAGYAGFAFLMMLPTILLMLLIASACQNMWLSLGIGVVLVFLCSILPQDNSILPLCPFSSPYQTLPSVQEKGKTIWFLTACGIETLFLGTIALILQRIRRYFS